jgi:alkanesulfonate monooxygenase SsuD/methylene tetrahydromethanopterin reductase-like flavin-dependent oxidoreductase (luciferase family)
MGFEREAAEIQDLYLDRRQREAAAAVPYEFLDQVSLLGPPDRIADRMRAFADAGATTLSIAPYGPTPEERIASLRTAVEAVARAGLA